MHAHTWPSCVWRADCERHRVAAGCSEAFRRVALVGPFCTIYSSGAERRILLAFSPFLPFRPPSLAGNSLSALAPRTSWLALSSLDAGAAPLPRMRRAITAGAAPLRACVVTARVVVAARSPRILLRALRRHYGCRPVAGTIGGAPSLPRGPALNDVIVIDALPSAFSLLFFARARLRPLSQRGVQWTYIVRFW